VQWKADHDGKGGGGGSGRRKLKQILKYCRETAWRERRKLQAILKIRILS
jgi:hypothetical protein